MLTAAPKGETVATVWLTPAEDGVMRAAFGRYGGAAEARAAAAGIVRRLETSGPGYWFHCDCRPDAERPPVLVPVAETHIRRHEAAAWPSHAVTCDFFREPPEQAELTRSFARLARRGLCLVRPWAGATCDVLDEVRVASPHTGRPQLARALVRLMTAAGLQQTGSAAFRPPTVPEQVRRLWGVAGGLELDRDVPVADYFCASLAGIPELVRKIAWAPPDRFPHTRAHGLLVLRLSAVRSGELVPLAGPLLPVVGRIAVPGEEPIADLTEDAPPPARAPYLAICLLARPAPREPVRVMSAYVHPCASHDRLMLVDSDLERQTLAQLLSLRAWLGRKRDVVVTLDKPLGTSGRPRRKARRPEGQSSRTSSCPRHGRTGTSGGGLLWRRWGLRTRGIGNARRGCIS